MDFKHSLSIVINYHSDINMRSFSKYLDDLIGRKIQVLDKGFVRVIDYMGNEASIVQAARVSYGQGTKSKKEDAALIDFLMRNEHTSPFEMCEIKLHVKMPIFVARQWIRHRTANVNELSARYSVIPKDFYEPVASRINPQSTDNKQSSENEEISNSAELLNKIIYNSECAHKNYQELLESGLSRELARICLSLNYYTEMYWKIDLHNLLRFLKLRIADGAQKEIRDYADVILEIVKSWVPNVYLSFENHCLNSVKFSGNAIKALKEKIAGKNISMNLAKNERESIEKYFNLNMAEEAK